MLQNVLTGESCSLEGVWAVKFKDGWGFVAGPGKSSWSKQRFMLEAFRAADGRIYVMNTETKQVTWLGNRSVTFDSKYVGLRLESASVATRVKVYRLSIPRGGQALFCQLRDLQDDVLPRFTSLWNNGLA